MELQCPFLLQSIEVSVVALSIDCNVIAAALYS